MSKRSVFTTITPIPADISRQAVLDMLHDHMAMIKLSPIVQKVIPCNPPPKSPTEEMDCKWYSITDKVQYLPGGMYSGKVSYHVCFRDLDDGLSTHCYAPLGLNIRSRWLVGGNVKGENRTAQELGLGLPKEGLYLREDIDMKCNIMLVKFVKANLKRGHGVLVERLVEQAKLHDVMGVTKQPESQQQQQQQQGEGQQQQSDIMTTQLSLPTPDGSVYSPALTAPGAYGTMSYPTSPVDQQRFSMPPPGYMPPMNSQSFSGVYPQSQSQQQYGVPVRTMSQSSQQHQQQMQDHRQSYAQYPQNPDSIGYNNNNNSNGGGGNGGMGMGVSRHSYELSSAPYSQQQQPYVTNPDIPSPASPPPPALPEKGVLQQQQQPLQQSIPAYPTIDEKDGLDMWAHGLVPYFPPETTTKKQQGMGGGGGQGHGFAVEMDGTGVQGVHGGGGGGGGGYYGEKQQGPVEMPGEGVDDAVLRGLGKEVN